LFIIPASLLFLIFSGKYRKELFYGLDERFACLKNFPKQSKKVIWVHCSSLGEVRAVEPVLDALNREFFIVLTTVTKTGRDYALKTQKADFVSLLPIDLIYLMRKAFKIIKPDILILVETELWASMLYAANAAKVKVMTVNGRMSEKSFKVYKLMKFFWKHFVRYIDLVLARSKDDAARFSYLSGKNTEVYVTGNIKYDRDFMADASRPDFGLKDGDMVFTAGSTREGEEEIIAAAYNKIREKFPEIKFFLAPRHLTRINKVKKILSANKIEFSLFSRKTYDKNFILVDVFGRLQDIYSVSDICYAGGSIVNKGGQNPIEPAAYGKPVLFGMYMGNFKAEAEILLKFGGAINVFDADDIAEKTIKLLSNKKFLSETGKNAVKAVNSQRGAVNLTAQKIREYIR
jgi:3-deoxy-D-manno-octulosonic-acid transferase